MVVSDFIRPRQTREIMRAARHAWRIERPLNTFVVINFPCPEGDELRPQRLFREIRTKIRSWLYYKRRERVVDPLTDVRTWEHVGDRYHVNWMLHIPEPYIEEFRRKLPVWVKKVLGEMPDGTLHEDKIWNLNGLLRYTLKGTLPSHAHRFGIEPEPQGIVWGRRAVSATCLGRRARERDAASGRVVPGRELKKRQFVRAAE